MAGHDVSAMNGSLASRATGAIMGALPEKLREEANAMGDSYFEFLACMHLASHPSLEHRVEDITRLKQPHDKGVKR
jgi:hypothetical protein